MVAMFSPQSTGTFPTDGRFLVQNGKPVLSVLLHPTGPYLTVLGLVVSDEHTLVALHFNRSSVGLFHKKQYSL